MEDERREWLGMAWKGGRVIRPQIVMAARAFFTLIPGAFFSFQYLASRVRALRLLSAVIFIFQRSRYPRARALNLVKVKLRRRVGPDSARGSSSPAAHRDDPGSNNRIALQAYPSAALSLSPSLSSSKPPLELSSSFYPFRSRLSRRHHRMRREKAQLCNG